MSSIVFALGILLFAEGALWALFPGAMKRAAMQAAASPESLLRYVGLAAAIFGVLLVWLVR